MTVLDRAALSESPLADLHLLATELGVDGFRRLRKDDLVDAIIAKQGGDGDGAEPASDEAPPAKKRSRSRRKKTDDEAVAEEVPAEVATEPVATGAAEPVDTDEDGQERRRPRRRRRGAAADEAEAPAVAAAEPAREPEESAGKPASRRRRGGGGADDEASRPEAGEDPAGPAGEERIVEGVVELLGNGSGFVRVNPPEPTDEDVYISAAQVKRCELVSGDRVAGPVRAPRRSERFPSLIRVDTINGQPADEVAEGTRFEDLPATFPTERLALGLEDPTIKAIEWLTPFGRGSRVTIVGPARSGKSEALRRIAAALGPQEGIEVSLVLAGARPEEVPGWQQGAVQPAAVSPYGQAAENQAQAAERVLEQAKRVAARGGHAVVLIDTLEYLAPHQARRLLSLARSIVDGGSLTVIATAPAPLGGESTVIALDHGLASMHRFPALDLLSSGTIRADLLVGEAGAEAIAKARAEAAR